MIHSGIILIDKPEGPSSAQVVHRVKKALGARKVGHLGSLDPFASGLLLVGVNEGTKIADIFLSGAKSYRGVMALGIETDSQDATGKVTQTRPVKPAGAAELRLLEKKFTGELEQIPPMFSALKKDGVRLYQLARQGKEVAREPRRITIYSMQLFETGAAAEIEFEVACSRGTYIRTLAADMGTALGCGAHLKSLCRTACGHLTLAQAISLDDLENCPADAALRLMPLATALEHLRAVSWPSRVISRLRLGQQELLFEIGRPQPGERLVRILDPLGGLAALAEWKEESPGARWRLFRIFQE